MADWLSREAADAVVLSALDSIAWTFNIRGGDVEHLPVVLAFALVNADGTADLFVDSGKLSQEVRDHLGDGVRVHERGVFETFLASLGGRTVAADPERCVAAIFEALERGGADVLPRRDPACARAIKNDVEIAGHRAAQARDSVALIRFLHWLSVEAGNGLIDECSAAQRLLDFRRATGELRDLSFPTISGAGPNGALIHYTVTDATNRRLKPGSLYLVDSGAQYIDGTTDVTRTIAIGVPTAEMRDRFTRVLKGHIALARARFPVGTCGGQIDALARQFLWQAGLDYAHGTGHGVGSYLAVHEGPQGIAPPVSSQRGGDEPLRPCMICSNEPGYYKEGEYGIRIENLVLVVRIDIPGAEKEMLGFETLTFAPVDRQLIDTSLLDAVELRWIDDYHRAVLKQAATRIDGDVLEWLTQACAPLEACVPEGGQLKLSYSRQPFRNHSLGRWPERGRSAR
jgi:Xaa-Pro aminopeptidase